MDICFLPDGGHARFIEAYTGTPALPGDFVSPGGTVLGRHKGITHYTVGQRKGMGVAAGKPLFVVQIDSERNRVVLDDEPALFSSELTAASPNFVSISSPEEPFRASVKIRYRAAAATALVTPLPDGRLRVVFDEPQRAVTPGQSAVFYRDDLLLGGGVIEG
jgi:tRNA-specific 2-thiouridylase